MLEMKIINNLFFFCKTTQYFRQAGMSKYCNLYLYYIDSGIRIIYKTESFPSIPMCSICWCFTYLSDREGRKSVQSISVGRPENWWSALSHGHGLSSILRLQMKEVYKFDYKAPEYNIFLLKSILFDFLLTKALLSKTSTN